MAWLILGLVLFHGLHSVRMVAPGWREDRIAAMGEGPWKGAYSVASIIALVVLIWGYGQARQDFLEVYFPPAWLLHPALLLLLASMIALAAYILPAGAIKAALKHPMLVAIKLWALAHLMVNGDLASVLLFGSFLVWAIMNRISVKRRGAPVPSRGPLKFDVMAVGLGVVFWAVLVWGLHEWLFGVAPVAG